MAQRGGACSGRENQNVYSSPTLNCSAVFRAALLALVIMLGSGVAGAQEYVPVGVGIEAIPGPNGEVGPNARDMFIRLSGDAAVQTGRPFRVWIDGQDVTANCRRDGDNIVCPVGALGNGTHRVTLSLPRLLGSDSEVSWQFTKGHLHESAGDLSLTHNARHTLYEGDELEVTLRGPVGGEAWVDIGDRVRMPLKETSPGVYTGRHDVKRDDYVTAAPVGHLRLPNGHLYRTQAEAPAKLMGRMFTIRILYPEPGSKVPWHFVIRGRTRPFARVSIAPILGTRPARQYGQVHDQAMNSNMGAMEVTADEHGAFEQSFGFPIHMFALRYAFNVTAVDREGNEALPASFEVLVGAEDEEKKAHRSSESLQK
jgi:hypothetical protein